MKFLIPATVIVLLAVMAKLVFAQGQTVTLTIPPQAVGKVQSALAFCNGQTGQPETATEFATRVVKEALKRCYEDGNRPNTVEFDETWPDDRQP